MKSKFTAVLSFLLLLAPLSLFAATKNSQSVSIPSDVTVAGTPLPAGDYKVQWEGTGNVTATINKGKKVIATVPGTVKQSKSGYDGALQVEGKALQGIQWKSTTIEFNQTDTASAPSGQ